MYTIDFWFRCFKKIETMDSAFNRSNKMETVNNTTPAQTACPTTCECCRGWTLASVEVFPPCIKCGQAAGLPNYIFQGVKTCWPCYIQAKTDAEALRKTNIENGLTCQCTKPLVDGACVLHGPLKKLCKCGALAIEITDKGVECSLCAEDLYA